MANVKSYAWGQRINEPVDDGGTVTVPTPGFVDPASYKTDEAQFVLDGTVLTAEQATGVWDAEFASIEVTNGVGMVWSPGQTLYVTVAGTPFDAANVEASFDALEARVTANEAAISALDARVAALEVPAGTRGGTPPTSGPPMPSPNPKHKGKAADEEDEEEAKPKGKPGTPHWDPSDIDKAEEEKAKSKHRK